MLVELSMTNNLRNERRVFKNKSHFISSFLQSQIKNFPINIIFLQRPNASELQKYLGLYKSGGKCILL